METTTTTCPVATNSALPEFGFDLEFARRSVQYMRKNGCEAALIIDTLTIDLGVSIDTAHELLSETTSLVAA